MSHLDDDGKSFYLYAMNLFSETGHVFTSIPEFVNHSSEQFIYFDNKPAASFSCEQRSMLRAFNNVSRLFSVNGCAFFSMNLLIAKRERSQAAHDIHSMLHPIVGFEGTICLFRYNEEVMLSFAGFGHRCILSDWFPMDDDIGNLSTRLDIANFSIDQGVDYFLDMVHLGARRYYIYSQPSLYEIFPIDFVSGAGLEGVSRAEFEQYMEYPLVALRREYGDDYVEYDDTVLSIEDTIGAELDLMSLEMDEEDTHSLGAEIEMEDDTLDEDEFFDKNMDETAQDKYEFDGVDPEIFRDPVLMVKWLEKNG